MRSEVKKLKLSTRRIFILLWSQIFLFFVLVSRLYFLQGLHFRKYRTLADSNRVKSIIIPPLRGNILDENGEKLAANRTYWRVLLNPALKNKKEIVTKLAEILQIKEYLLYKNIAKSRKRRVLADIVVYDHLSWKEVAKVEVNINDLPGVYIEEGRFRHYPYKFITSHIIGYVAAVSEREMGKASNNPLLNHPDFRIGKNGLEKIMETQLRGTAGIKYREVNAYGLAVRDLKLSDSRDSKAGKDIQLTINTQLQKYSYERLKEHRGAVVLMDIKSGNIKSIVSKPGFDPNEFLTGISSEKWKDLIESEDKPLINRTVSSKYPPGSTFKLVTALAALQNNAKPERKMNCRGYIWLGRRKYHCWKEEGHGLINMHEAIAQSCNSYFYRLSQEVGIQKIGDIAHSFGLGELYDIELFNQTKGLIPTKEWKKKNYNEPWVVGDTLNSAIGQGFVEATPLQLAVMVARFASGGKKVVPHLIKNENLDEVDLESIGFEQKHIDFILSAMVDVVNHKKGTTYYRRIKKKNYEMAGKTGTSQVIAIDRNNPDQKLDYKHRNHGIFVGFAPIHDPKFAISVIVEHGGSGSGSAAPVARDILYKAQILEKSLPSKQTPNLT